MGKKQAANKRPRQPIPEPTPPSGDATPRFHTPDAELNYRSFKRRNIVQERGMVVESEFTDYIARAKWRDFVRTPAHGGDRELTFEFYSNLMAEPSNIVYVRGTQVRITPHDINQFYGLPDYPVDEYSQLLTSGYDLSDLMLVLIGDPTIPAPTWTHIKRERLTREAKLIYYFLAARIMPTTVNSEVHKVRAILTYAIVKGMTVDIGKIINASMKATRDAHGTWYSFGFPALIRSLTRAAGYSAPTLDASIVRTKAPISFRLLDTAGRGRASQGEHQREEEAEEAEASGSHTTVEDRLTALEQSVGEMGGRIDAIQTALDSGFQSMQEFMAAQFADLRRRFPSSS